MSIEDSSLADTTAEPSLNLPGLLQQRCAGRLNGLQFRNTLVNQRSQRKGLSHRTKILSNEPSITSLQIHRRESRFLLTGSTTGRCTIYDLSRYGGKMDGHSYILHHRQQQNHNSQNATTRTNITLHKPIAQTDPVETRDHTTTTTTDDDYPASSTAPRTAVPRRRQALVGPVTCTRWYPPDSGIFLSSHVSGRLCVWDTNALVPVLRLKPFASDGVHQRSHDNEGDDSLPIRSAVLNVMETTPHLPHLIAVGSHDSSLVRLVDIRSGAAAHTLTGHRHGGVTTLAWSPVVPHVLASGGADATIRLWDVRKAGRHAWLGDGPLDANNMATLGQDDGTTLVRSAYRPDYRHWNDSSRKKQPRSSSTASSRQPGTRGPNDFSEQRATESHQASVANLTFSEDGHYLASCGMDDEGVKVWDMNTRQVVPRFYSGANTSSQLARKGTTLMVHDRTMWMTRGLYLYRYDWLAGGRPLQQLTGHLNLIQAVDRCPDTGNLVTGGADGLVLLWESTEGSLSTDSSSVPRNGRKRKMPIVDHDNW